MSDSLGFTLFDFTQTVFNSDALTLPLDGLSLASFRWSKFVHESNLGTVQGHPTSLSCVSGCSIETSPVPEPQTWALMLARVGVLGSISRRRSKA